MDIQGRFLKRLREAGMMLESLVSQTAWGWGGGRNRFFPCCASLSKLRSFL